MKCDFCAEISGKSGHSFKEIYPALKTRIIYEDDQFVVLPTLGQIFENSLLILPKVHFQTCAEMPLEFRRNLELLILKINEKLQSDNSITFEHGAKAATGSSCGIYHAHMHHWPIPSGLDYRLDDIFPHFENCDNTLNEALAKVNKSSDYLCIGSSGRYLTSEVSNLHFKPQSQYFRRKIVEYFGLNQDWDWRKYQTSEDMLLSTIKTFSS